MERSATAGELSRSKPATRRDLFGNKKVLGVAAVVVLALVYLIYSGIQSTGIYYLTVDELLARGEAAYGEQTRISGKVVEGTVQSEPKAMTLRFVASGESRTIPVVYKGVVPDSFKPGADVVLEGTLVSGGAFEANTLLAKCPTKYAPAP